MLENGLHVQRFGVADNAKDAVKVAKELSKSNIKVVNWCKEDEDWWTKEKKFLIKILWTKNPTKVIFSQKNLIHDFII